MEIRNRVKAQKAMADQTRVKNFIGGRRVGKEDTEAVKKRLNDNIAANPALKFLFPTGRTLRKGKGFYDSLGKGFYDSLSNINIILIRTLQDIQYSIYHMNITEHVVTISTYSHHISTFGQVNTTI
jgi:hypothetical protein